MESDLKSPYFYTKFFFILPESSPLSTPFTRKFYTGYLLSPGSTSELPPGTIYSTMFFRRVNREICLLLSSSLPFLPLGSQKEEEQGKHAHYTRRIQRIRLPELQI